MHLLLVHNLDVGATIVLGHVEALTNVLGPEVNYYCYHCVGIARLTIGQRGFHVRRECFDYLVLGILYGDL